MEEESGTQNPVGARQKLANAQRRQLESQYRRRRGASGYLIWFIGIAIIGGFWYWRGGRVHFNFHARPASTASVPANLPSLLAQPDQRSDNLPAAFSFKGYTLTPAASYTLTARVLSTETYHADHQSDISPVDLALGWSLMSSTKVLSGISITQGGRFYNWWTNDWPIEREQIETMSANTHIIPADDAVWDQATSLSTGDIVTLGGYLVNVRHPDGFYWNTSLTRGDTGDGSCEVFYVQYIVQH